MGVGNKFGEFLQRNWERLACSAAGLMMIAVLATCLLTVLGWLKKEEPRPVRDVAASTIFDDSAFPYLSRRAPNSELDADHCFTVKPPADWNKPAIVTPTSPGMAMDENQLRDSLALSIRRAKVVRPPEPEPEPDPIAPPPTVARVRPPTPKPPRYLTYKGVIRTTSGQQMALVTIEDTATGDRKSLYAKPGSPIADGSLRVDAFSSDAIRIRTRSGATMTVPYGDKKAFR
jgi:hypothetical protein